MRTPGASLLKKTLFVLGLVWRIHPAFSQVPLSPEAEISLLTGSPGNALYTTFGHSAIRVRDPRQDLDLVFNYGTFDFSTPNFYLKFLRGKLDYMLSVEAFDRFQRGYYYGNQWVIEQVLQLDSAQKQAVFNFLAINYQPENRFYKYDFFFDNCATRIRDLFHASLGNRLHAAYPAGWSENPATFRQLLRHYLQGWHLWSGFGIDIILGMPTDRPARPEQYLFLPDFMAEAYRISRIEHPGHSQAPFVAGEETIITNQPVPVPPGYLMPLPVTWAFFSLVLLLSILGLNRRKALAGIDLFLFGLAGIVGLLIVFLWFFTEHSATKDNLNILWAWPFHLALPFFLINGKSGRAMRIYLRAVLAVLAVLLAAWPILPQHLHPALIPLLLAMMTRAALHLRLHQLLRSNISDPNAI
jgi:hypothetical protein